MGTVGYKRLLIERAVNYHVHFESASVQVKSLSAEALRMLTVTSQATYQVTAATAWVQLENHL